MEKPNQGVRSAKRGQRMSRWASHIVIAVIAFAIGGTTRQREPTDATTAAAEDRGTNRVTGIGGVFFKSDDPAALSSWYRTHLGIASEDWGGFAFQWQEKGRPNETGYTIWSAFSDTTSYFSPSEERFMVNFRVADLASLIAALKEEGVRVVGEIEQHPNGDFAWILDPEGRKVELWEPVASDDDPYLG